MNIVAWTPIVGSVAHYQEVKRVAKWGKSRDLERRRIVASDGTPLVRRAGPRPCFYAKVQTGSDATRGLPTHAR
jgi:hypothetical protein